jgi:hypothetical protein
VHLTDAGAHRAERGERLGAEGARNVDNDRSPGASGRGDPREPLGQLADAAVAHGKHDDVHID